MREISPREIDKNAISLIAEDWALLTAGNADGWNTMTVSWGGIGELWGKDVAFTFVRPQRYTKEFIDNGEFFSLSFFYENYRPALSYCGTASGRDENKFEKAGLTPAARYSIPYPDEAKLVFLCHKMATVPMNKDTLSDKSILPKFYEDEDMHTMYVGEIIEAMAR